ncbi:MAG: amino acid adenylation domain-containing protein [Synechococcaceae cyanobacterium SM2_3_1]|nr:amino acid adenylation domain-containing protein [Synechococcaceae cyanobacterium SM2_3_1]
MQTYRGDSCSFQLTPELTQQLKDLARQEKVSLHTLLLSIYLIFLHRYSQQSDVIVGSPTLGRNGSEFQSIVGHFVNMVPIRSLISDPCSFLDFLQQTRQTVLESLDHQDFPLAVLVERLQPQRDASYSPIFQTTFELEQFERSPEADHTPVEWGGLRLIPQPLRLFEGQFDLDLEMLDSNTGLLGMFKYNSDLFNRSTIERMQVHFQTLLQGIISNPQNQIQTLPLLTRSEQEQLQQWQATGQEIPQDRCIHQLFEAQVQRTPEAIALVFGQKALSYRELDRRANQLAWSLQTLGIGPEIRVALCVERGPEMVIGILGILKAGGAYVPLDPSYPPERLQFMLQDAEASVLLTQASLLPILKIPSSCQVQVLCLDRDTALLTPMPTDPCQAQPSPQHLAYIIYTSGSTGQPKGVMIPHTNLVNAYFAWDQVYHLSSQIHSHLQMASFAFDVFTGDWVRALCSGGKLVICPREYLLEPQQLYSLMRREQVDCAEFVPAVIRSLMDYLQDTDQDLKEMQVLIVGSDSWTLEEMDRLRGFCASQARIISSYGVTEATIDSSYFETTDLYLSRQHQVPIGRPLANTQLWILDPARNPVAIGVVGELYIAGAGVAKGYWNRPDLTQAKFVTIALNGGEPRRCYQTGDLARYLPDGIVELMGRMDHQVKIRGYRIELGDIESVLNQHDQVQQAVVVAESTVAGSKRLLAYVQGQELDPTNLKAYLKQQLPDYMVPAIIIPLAAFPLTPNGKVDRKALPKPDQDQTSSRAAAPRTQLEQTLATLWQQILGREAIGIHENFFALGGDSILSIQVIARARQQGIHLSPRQLFQHQTIAELAATLDHQPPSPRSAQQNQVTGAVPLTPIQRWFLDQAWPNPHHFNQAILLQVPPTLQVEVLQHSLNRVIEHHDALRLRFQEKTEGWQQFHTQESVTADLKLIDLQDLPPEEQSSTLETLAAQHQTHLHLSTGPLLQAVLFQLGSDQPNRLLLILHHLVVDAISWRILLTDLFDSYQQKSRGQDPKLPPKTTALSRLGLTVAVR